jgi:TPR repeat protein
LGVRYSTGRDVEQDMIAAHKWLNLAATMGHQEAKTWRADIASEMTKAQIVEAQKQARAWLQAREAKRPRETEEAAPLPQPAVKRPIYVRRHAQAMRSAKSFARVCACA